MWPRPLSVLAAIARGHQTAIRRLRTSRPGFLCKRLLPSEIRLPQPSDAVSKAVQYRVPLDLREWQQPALGDLGINDGVESRRELG
jgi:hypothetical protein